MDVYKDRNVIHSNKELPKQAKEAVKNLYRHYFHLSMANKLVKRTVFTSNDIQPYEGINMWEDNATMYRVFYHADTLIQVRGTYYYYNRCNESSLSIGYKDNSVQQMIRCATYLTDFFQSKPDANEFKKSVQFIQFCAKINLITTKFSGIKKFKSTFPETISLPEEYDKCAFSPRGRLRLFFVEHHLTALFVLLFKIKAVLSR